VVRQGAVLIVDDDEAMREALADILGDEGYQTIEAASGSAALAAMREPGRQIALVLLDFVMPGMSGAGVIAEKMKDASIRDIPVILMTGFGKDEVDVDDGVVAIISKSTRTESWLAMVKNLCKP